MLINFFNSKELNELYSISFSYIFSAEYYDGLIGRLESNIESHPIRILNIPQFFLLINKFPLIFKKIILAGFRAVIYYPMLIYYVYTLSRIFKKINPQILHINNGGYPAANSSIAAVIAGKMVGIPRILMVVNNIAADYKHYSRWLDFPLDQLVAHLVNVFITGSNAASIVLKKILLLPHQKIISINNGVDLINSKKLKRDALKELSLSNFEGCIFGVVAQLIERKGHKVLLDAVSQLVAKKNIEKKDFIVLIEGVGPLHSSLIDFANKKGINSWVKFIGEAESISDFMATIDVLILPSIKEEDFPNVIIEAMSVGKPVVSSRLAGTPEQVIDGVTGILFPPGDTHKLTMALHELLYDDNKRQLFGIKAAELFKKRFTASIAVKKYINLYQNL